MTSPDDPEDRVGQVLLGKLQVIRRIGGGGMGEVYEVEHLLTRHRRALKIVRAELARQRRFVERFLREAGIAGRLKTPFVAETFDAGWLEDESAYVLMELLPGRSLFTLLGDEGPLSERRACSLMCQVAEGMMVAHEAGIIHRDLKPENVFVTVIEGGAERVKILDFGVSKFLDLADEKATKLTREGSVLGTPYYMSPEQAAGKELDGRSDVWAIGVMAYEILTGRLPFDGETVGEVMLKIGGGSYVPLEHRRPDLDPAVVHVIARTLESDVKRRLPSAEALRRELLPFAGGEPAARAKTISDGAGPNDDFRGIELPGPPRVPATLGDDVLGASAPSPRVRTPRSMPPVAAVKIGPSSTPPPAGRVRSVPPVAASSGTPTRSGGSRSIPIAIAATFIVATIAGAFLGNAAWAPSAPAGSAAASTEPGRAAADAGLAPPSVPSPLAVAPSEPPITPEPSPTLAPEPPPRLPPSPRGAGPHGPRTPAEAAGLEENPYGP